MLRLNLGIGLGWVWFGLVCTFFLVLLGDAEFWCVKLWISFGRGECLKQLQLCNCFCYVVISGVDLLGFIFNYCSFW